MISLIELHDKRKVFRVPKPHLFVIYYVCSVGGGGVVGEHSSEP